ncbi:MAG: hypothetical protein PHQ43_00045 [Dehalococcoidales bacterium]|nr:hypothetical protein [Dehalococcoidales bacterium]
MKIAYADPPYIGCANYYPEKDEVDHLELLTRLYRDYEAWALSCSTPSLKQILGDCPDDVRIAAWVKPFASFKPNVNPAYAWEPVIFTPARERFTREQPTVRDWIAANITMHKGLVGAKPPKFAYWLFDLLGLEPTDEFDDLYPGTGIISRCWNDWRMMKRNEPIKLAMTLP